jgi:hypothetical protein
MVARMHELAYHRPTPEMLLAPARCITREFTETAIRDDELLEELADLLFGRKELWLVFSDFLITADECLCALTANLVSFALSRQPEPLLM